MARDRIVKLDDCPIQSIGWLSEENEYNAINVGFNGVTKIDCIEQYAGEYSIFWIQVWKDKKLCARYNARNIDSITYEDE